MYLWIIIALLLIIFYLLISKGISRLFLSILIIIGALIGIGFEYLILSIVGEDQDINEVIKILIPLIASMVAAGSVVIATYNTVNGEKSSKGRSILEFIGITRDILDKGDIQTRSNEILNEINNKLKSPVFKVDVLVNNGAREFYDFLNKDEGKNRKDIIENLEREFTFTPDSKLDKLKQELILMLKDKDIREMRKLWVNINQLAGSPATKYKKLEDQSSYLLTKNFIEKDLIKSKFYTESLLKKNRKSIVSLLKRHSELDYSQLPIQYYEVYRVCNKILEDNYEDIGHFFRTVHRTLKMINAYYKKNSPEYKEHIGIFRAQIPNQVALLIFYNAVYTEKGRGMARELIASNFFGDQDDFYFNEENEILRSEHFLKNKRTLNNQDAKIAYKFFTYNKVSKKLLKNNWRKIWRRKDKNNSIQEELFTHQLFINEKNLLTNFIGEFTESPLKIDDFKVFVGNN